MAEVLFSVIVPIYNVEKYLNKCVCSILAQTYNNFELILVDDGSKDSCPNICDDFAKQDARIKVIHKENGGLVSARKAGASLTSGKFVVCVDGDDWVEPTLLYEFSEAISNYNPDIICCNSFNAFSDQEKKEGYFNLSLGYYDKQKIQQEIYPQLIENNRGKYFPPSLWGRAFRRDLYLFNQLKVPDVISIGEDHACTKPCIYQANSIYVLNKCLYNYRQNLSSMTKNKKAFPWAGPKAIGEHFEKQIDMTKADFQQQVYRNVVHNLFNVAVSQFNRKEKYRTIKKDILSNISDPYYQKAISNVFYTKSLKNKLASMSLRKRLIFLMFLYNKVK